VTVPPRPTPMDLTMHHMAQNQPSISQTIGLFLHLEGTPPPIGELRSHVAAHLHLEPRLTHYLHGPGLAARWRHDPAPDLDTRIREHHVQPGNAHLDTALQELVAHPLPDQGPLWDLWLVSGYAPDRYAICCRGHHSTQDGMGLINTLHTLFGDAAPPAAPPVARPGAGTYLRAVRSSLAACARNGIWDDPARPLTGTRAVSWAQVPTEQLRTAATQRGGDTNAGFLAALSGALRTWSGAYWPRGTGRSLPAVIAVNIRRAEEQDRPGNLITFAHALLPCEEAAAGSRLDRIVATTRATREPARHQAMRTLMDLTPARAFHALATRITTPDRAAITTSYLAIHRPLRYRDDPVTHVQPLTWLPPNQPASVAACSYDGTTSVCFVTDAAVPELGGLADLFGDAAEELSPRHDVPEQAGGPRTPSPSPAPDGEHTQPVIDYALIKELLVEHAALPAEPITQDATQTQAGIDSMAVIALSMALEDRLGLLITEHELGQAPTVAHLVRLVSQRAALLPR
jgi:diacylglycerol O-acyltransferase